MKTNREIQTRLTVFYIPVSDRLSAVLSKGCRSHFRLSAKKATNKLRRRMKGDIPGERKYKQVQRKNP